MLENHNYNDELAERSRASAYLRLFIRHQKRIQTYILMLIPSYADADDVFQEVATIMWAKFDHFQPGTNFAAWAIAIAQNCVREYYRKQSKQARILENEVLDIVAGRTDQFVKTKTTEHDRYIDALRECMANLENKDRRIIQMRYEQGLAPQKIADAFKRNRMGIYRTLARIHETLVKCVRRRLAQESPA